MDSTEMGNGMKEQGSAYARILDLFANDEIVILNGGVSTEIERVGGRSHPISDTELWGTWALYHAPYRALEVHKRYVDVGCDVISTATWGIMGAPEMESRVSGPAGLRHWLDVARLGIRLAREAASGNGGKTAVAFSVNGDISSARGLERLRLLARVFEKDPPDLVLMETMSLIREGLTFEAVDTLLQTGLPLWLSFRRCRFGLCGVYGQHWGGPEGDLFGRAAHKFEQMGVGALLINCLPADHVPGMVPWLRDFTDLPLGVYPNLGRYLDPGWQFDDKVGPGDYAELALAWRREGAQLVGGCCGVTPEHIQAVRERLKGTKPGRGERAEATLLDAGIYGDDSSEQMPPIVEPWVDARGRQIFPLPFPDIACDRNVFPPTQGSFLVWKHLFQSGAGQGKRCLDVGCGTGILAVQLALNGAEEVLAIDIQRQAVANTLANAVRNGVGDQVKGHVADLYSYTPDHKYDLIVASLYQMPVDPMEAGSGGHRPADFWGRNLLDHLISRLPDLLSPDGLAYVMQISVLGQLRTTELLEQQGFRCRTVDFSFFHFSPLFLQNLDQIHRVEELSDAYHLNFGDEHVMIMYLLEVTRKAD